MISEVSRLVDISKFYGSQLVKGDHLPKWMFKDLEKKTRKKIFQIAQCYDKYKKTYKYKEVTINCVMHKNVDEPRTIFMVMLELPNLNERDYRIKKLSYECEREDEEAVVLFVDIQ